MDKKKYPRTYRFAPAYILLFLARESLYGSAILNVFHSQLPDYNVDSAVVYRALQEMEREGMLKSRWKAEEPGPATKWYEITEKGLQRLGEYRAEIEKRKNNLEFFLNTYGKLKEKGITR